MINRNQKGFTLIELMIVIAIIGILAAIAIPNFIAYRNKAYCSKAETDAQNVVAALSSYFSEPSHTAIPTTGELTSLEDMQLNRPNSVVVTSGATGSKVWATIAVTDGTQRCPRSNGGSVPYTTYFGTTNAQGAGWHN